MRQHSTGSDPGNPRFIGKILSANWVVSATLRTQLCIVRSKMCGPHESLLLLLLLCNPLPAHREFDMEHPVGRNISTTVLPSPISHLPSLNRLPQLQTCSPPPCLGPGPPYCLSRIPHLETASSSSGPSPCLETQIQSSSTINCSPPSCCPQISDHLELGLS